jgi:hypothetical protein
MELVFRTLQRPLPPLLRLHAITIEAANRYPAESYVPEHNARFAPAAAEEEGVFAPFAPAFRDILSVKDE